MRARLDVVLLAQGDVQSEDTPESRRSNEQPDVPRDQGPRGTGQ
jgi:hypothetical protein